MKLSSPVIGSYRSPLSLLPWLVASVACNAPDPPGPTGGTDVPPGACGRGLAVVCSDYQSTNVALVDVDGEVLSSSFISSATTAAELSAPLSGDVATPTALTAGDDLALLDRYPAAVLTWVNISSGAVRAQLSVATGFAANPQDYLQITDTKAYVSRYEHNPTPGAEPNDAGADLLIVDPASPAITGRVDLGAAMKAGEAGFSPHPNRMVRAGDFAFVLLAAYTADYTAAADSRIAVVDVHSDAFVGVTLLEGLRGCAGMNASDDGSQLAVTCSGSFAGSSTPTTSDAAVVLLAIDSSSSASPPSLSEQSRWSPSELDGRPPGFTVDFIRADRLLLTTMGQFASGGGADLPDTLIELDASTGEHRSLWSTPLPFELGEVSCTEPCARCYAADADAGILARLSPADDGWLAVDQRVVVDSAIGLPPRGLGRF